MSSITSNFFSSSECERLKSLLKNPEKDLEEIVSLLEYKAELKLRESEEKYSNLFQYSNDAIILHDLEGNIVDINQNARKWLGYTISEFLKMNISQLHPSKDLDLSKNKLNDIKKNKFVNFEISFKRKNGEIFPADLSSKIIEIDDKTLIQGEIRDITDMKKAEQKLKESEERYRGLVNNITDIIYELDISGKCTYVSNQLFEISGFHPEELIGQNLFKFLHPEDFSNIIEKVKEAFNKGIRISTDFSLQHKDGHYVPVSSNFNVIQINDEQRFIGVLRDNTEKRKAEEKLKESEEKFRLVFEAIADPIHVIDADLKIIYMNPAFEKWLKSYNLYFDAIGKNPVEAWPHIGEGVNDEYKKVFETKQIHIKEDWTHINDIDIFTEARKIPIIKSGKVIQVITIVRDFSDRKKAEQKLKESEEKFRNFTEQSLMGVAIIQDSVVKYASKRLADIYGYSVEEMLNFEPNGFLKLIDPEFLEIVKEQATKKQLGQTDVITHYEVKCVKKTGEKFWVENYSKTINYKGKPADFVTNIEITERKKTEQLLIESEEISRNLANQWRTTFDAMSECVFLLDLGRKILQCNKITLDFLGKKDYDEIIGYSCCEITHGTNEPVEWCPMVRMIESSHKESSIAQIGDKWCEISVDPVINDKGILIGAVHIITDITERKEVERELKESEEKFRTITEQTLMGIIIIQDGLVIYVNEAESSIMEYTIQELMEWNQEDLFKHIHPDDITKAINRSQEMQERQEGQDIHPFFAYRIVTKSGKAKNVEVNTQEIEFNEKPATLTYVLDVSEKKEAEQKYESLINNLTDIVLELDMRGIVTYSNYQCYDILGYQPSEIIDKSAFNFIYPEDISIIAEKMKEAFSTKELVSVLQYRLVHKNRDIIHASAMGKYVNVGGNEKFIVTIRDITFQKKIEQELKLSEEKYRLLFDNTPVGIGLSTIDGRVLDSNNAMVKLTGFSVEDLNKIGASSMYADQNQRSEILKLLKKSGKLRDYEVTLRRKDNTEFLGSVSFDLLDLRGEKIIQTSLRDITKSKEAELELIKLSNLKSELLRRTSHELKTPLVSIKGFTDLLLDLHREKLDDYIVSNLNQIRKGCIRLEYLISDILNAAELESDTIQARKSEEDLSFLIKFCVKELKGLSELRKQIIKIEILEPLVILIEKEEIHKVISNILSNAIKYTPPYGTIKIRSEIQDDFIVISVKDNGIGFTEEEKSRIFKQFGKIERYGQGMDVISEGSGLGLYISKKIIELHGGKIWVESNGNKKGSTFYFSLPLIEKF